MTITFETLFIWFIFPLSAEVLFAYIFQDWINWLGMDTAERFFFFFVFLFATFPALLLPAMGAISLTVNLFNSLYY